MIVAAAAHTVGAQAVAATEDEAITVPGGVVRWSVSEADTRYSSRYGTGGLQPLGRDLSVDSLGVGQLPILAPLQSSLRTLTQDPTLRVTLGATQVTSSVRISVTPVGIDVGLTHWLTLRGIVPIVRTRNEILFNPNPGGKTGNIGLNPALANATALAVDTALYGQFAAAGSSLQAAVAACQANPGSASYCPSLNAQSAAATALIAQASAFAAALARVYGTAGHVGPVVPVDSSAAWIAIANRLRSLAGGYAHFDSLTGGPLIIGRPPAGAPPLALADAQQLITTNVLGLRLDSLQTVSSVHLGDIEIGATALLLDSFHGSDSSRLHPRGFNYRLALTGLYRLGTGVPTSADALSGVSTGTGANAVELHAATDVLFGRHLWASVLVRGTLPFSDRVSARIPLALGEVFPPAFARQTVSRTLGRTIDIEIDPRYTINNYFGILTQYRFIRKSADTYSGTFALDSATTGFGPVTLDASTLGVGTATTEHRWGVGVTYSTVEGASRHGSRIPFDISFFHYQTLTGSAGAYSMLPRLESDAVQFRLYTRLLGGGGAFTHR